VTIFADAISTLQAVMAVVGTVLTFLGLILGLLLALRRRADSKAQQKRLDEKESSKRTAKILEKLALIEKTQETYDRQYSDLRSFAEAQFKEISVIVKEIQNNCVRHQHTAALDTVQQSLQRVANRLDDISRELQAHKEACADKYLTYDGYQNDLTLWTNNFDTLRQSLRDVNTLVTRLLNGRVGK
jgi:chromosome segregation ATPase